MPAQAYQLMKITREEGLPTTGINDMVQDQFGMYWLATEGAGLVRFDGKSFFIDEEVSAYGTLVINSLGFDEEQNLWLVTDKEILKHNGFSLTTISTALKGLQWYASGNSKVFFRQGGNYFSIQADTLVRVEKPTGISQKQDFTYSEFKGGLPEDMPQSLKVFKDADGVLWFYGPDGLYYVKGTFLQNVDLGFEPTAITLLNTNYCYSGLNTVSGISTNLKNNVQSYAPKGLVTDLEGFKNKLYVATENGLLEYSKNSIKNIELPDNDGFVFRLFADLDYLYVAGGRFLYRYDGSRLENLSLKFNLPQATIFDISKARDGALWFGTYTSGFIRYHKNQFNVLEGLERFSFDSLRISCIHAVSANELWLGTFTEGLYHVSKKGIEHYNYNNLNFAEIRSLAADKDGRIWAGTGKGLYWITPGITQGKAFVKVSDAPCLDNTLKIFEGNILYGSGNGLVKFDIEKWITQYRQEVHLSITQVNLLFEDGPNLLAYSRDSTAFYKLPLEMHLPYDQNFLTFKFSGNTSLYNNAVEYRYRLKGQTNSWTEALQNNEAVYSNLSPGNYIFQVQARRKGNGWPQESTTLPFTINRPFYATWWFILMMSIATVLATYFVINQRIKQANQKLRMQNALMEMERKALRMQMNPHFIFNALDSISSFIFKKDPQQAVKYLNSFAKLMRLTLESSMEHVHPVETEVSILKNYLELEKLRFSDKFTYQIELDDEIDYDIGIPPMLVQPHVENAILHGIKPKEGNGFISIKFFLRNDQLICEIEDDGIGRKAAKELPNKKAHRSMATQINRDRVRLLRLSTEDERVDLNYVDKVDEQGRPSGTKVIITLVAEEI